MMVLAKAAGHSRGRRQLACWRGETDYGRKEAPEEGCWSSWAHPGREGGGMTGAC